MSFSVKSFSVFSRFEVFGVVLRCESTLKRHSGIWHKRVTTYFFVKGGFGFDQREVM